MRLYNHLLPRVVVNLSIAASKIHVSFDGWTTKGGKKGYLGIVAHYVDSKGKLVDVPIALPQLMGAHSGENMAEIVYSTVQKFGVTPRMTSEISKAAAFYGTCSADTKVRRWTTLEFSGGALSPTDVGHCEGWPSKHLSRCIT